MLLTLLIPNRQRIYTITETSKEKQYKTNALNSESLWIICESVHFNTCVSIKLFI